MPASLEEERAQFISLTRTLPEERLLESLETNQKLIYLFQQQKGEIPEVLEMMCTVLKDELDSRKTGKNEPA